MMSPQKLSVAETVVLPSKPTPREAMDMSRVSAVWHAAGGARQLGGVGREMESGQADAGGHQPGPVLGRPPTCRLAGGGHDEEEGQLRTFEIEDATLVIEIEPLALEILAMGSVHDLSVTGAC